MSTTAIFYKTVKNNYDQFFAMNMKRIVERSGRELIDDFSIEFTTNTNRKIEL